jgi:hypothetical protein
MIPSSLTDIIKQSIAYKHILVRLINARNSSRAASQTAFSERRQVHLPGVPLLLFFPVVAHENNHVPNPVFSQR